VCPNWSQLLEGNEEVILNALAQRKIKEENPTSKQSLEVYQKLGNTRGSHKSAGEHGGDLERQ